MKENQLKLALVLYELGMSIDIIETIAEVDENTLKDYQSIVKRNKQKQ